MAIYTDASTWGWGARSGETTIGGTWNDTEVALHINCLELLGAWYATQALIQERENLTILLWIDNWSTVAYINHMGGTHSSQLPIVNLAIQFWLWVLKEGIVLMAKHIAGKNNVSEDWMSHAHRDQIDWMLNQKVYQKINQLWGSGSICHKTVSTASMVLQLETGTPSRESGCIPSRLVNSQRICTPSLVSDIQMSKESPRSTPHWEAHNGCQ